jgi:hypothetical protein
MLSIFVLMFELISCKYIINKEQGRSEGNEEEARFSMCSSLYLVYDLVGDRYESGCTNRCRKDRSD